VSTLTYTGQLVEVGPCWKCGLHFAVPEDFDRRNKNEGRSWWCPGCGSAAVYKRTRVQELEQQLVTQRQRLHYTEEAKAEALEQRDHARAQANGYKGALVKTKRRIANGVCPCCQRTFTDVQRHMRSKHPDYGQPVEAS